MKDYLTLWVEGPSDEGSRTLTAPVTVIGEWTVSEIRICKSLVDGPTGERLRCG